MSGHDDDVDNNNKGSQLIYDALHVICQLDVNVYVLELQKSVQRRRSLPSYSEMKLTDRHNTQI